MNISYAVQRQFVNPLTNNGAGREELTEHEATEYVAFVLQVKGLLGEGGFQVDYETNVCYNRCDISSKYSKLYTVLYVSDPLI